MLIKFLVILIILKSMSNQVNSEDYSGNDYSVDGSAPNPKTVSDILDKITDSSSYKKESRPTRKYPNDTNVDEDGSLIMKIMISYRQLISLDEKLQVLSSSFYLFLSWGDPRLKWNPSEYNDETEIVAPASKFWMPDIAIINSASSITIIQYVSNLNVLITSDGDMFVSIAIPIQQTKCKLEVYKYPFDTQTCTITIGSWGFSNRELNFEVLNTTLQYYTSHPIWNLISLKQKTKTNRNRFDLINIDFSSKNKLPVRGEDVQFILTLKRNPLYIMVNGIFPCLVLNCVVLIAFFIPHAQQIALCMTSFLAFIMSSVRISSDIPVQSDYLPLITLYFLLSVMYTLVGFLWFIILETFNQRKKLPKILMLLAKLTKKIPTWIFKTEMAKEKKVNPSVNLPTHQPNIIKLSETEIISQKIIESEQQDMFNKKIEENKCNFCNRCNECSKQVEKEKKSKQEQAEFKSNLEALNYLGFIILSLFIFISNTTIWSLISSK